MTKYIRIMTLVLAAILCLALLVGCGNNAEETDTKDAQTTASAGDDTTAPAGDDTTDPADNTDTDEPSAPVETREADDDDCAKDIF